MQKKKTYTKNVYLLSFVSLFTDMASEMLYPLMPIIWSSAGYSVQFIGIIEGVAEATSGLSKFVWGWLADRFVAHKRLVVIGYFVSALMKPLFGLTSIPAVPLIARNVERLGKAIRGAPRDALLAADSTRQTRTKVVGFHRAMDTLGAALGPLIALGALFVWQGNINRVFILAIIPGALAVWLTLKINDKKVVTKKVKQPLTPKASFKLLAGERKYRSVVVGLFLFAVINSSDVFIILRLREMGMSAVSIVMVYTLYNLVYAYAAKRTHSLVDRIGFRFSLLVCLVLFACTYATLSFDVTILQAVIVIPLYGIFAGLFEVTSKSWVLELSPPHLRATAIGLSSAVTSVGFLCASLITGALWMKVGGSDTLGLLAVAAFVPFAYFSIFHFDNKAAV